MARTPAARRRFSVAMFAALMAVWGCGRDTIAGPASVRDARPLRQTNPGDPPPPTLSGEVLQGSGTFTQTGNCQTDDLVTIAFEFSGAAVGPYPGTFTDEGRLTLRYVTDPVLGRVGTPPDPAAFTATFVIQSPSGLVSGMKSGIFGFGQSRLAQCDPTGRVGFPRGFGFFLEYTATIETPSGRFRDEGVSAVNLFGASVHFELLESFASHLTAPVPVLEHGPSEPGTPGAPDCRGKTAAFVARAGPASGFPPPGKGLHDAIEAYCAGL